MNTDEGKCCNKLFILPISSFISKVQCLPQKGQNSDAIKEVTSKGRDVYPSDKQTQL